MIKRYTNLRILYFYWTGHVIRVNDDMLPKVIFYILEIFKHFLRTTNRSQMAQSLRAYAKMEHVLVVVNESVTRPSQGQHGAV